MKPIEFDGQNTVLQKPESMTDEECQPLPCFRDGKQVISKWELTEEEQEHVAKHGFIWVSVIGDNQPPILPIAKEIIFETNK